MLKQKEMEIERLQQQLESKKSSGSSDSSVDVCAAVELDEDPSAAYATEVGCPPWHLFLAIKKRKGKKRKEKKRKEKKRKEKKRLSPSASI